MMKHGLAVLLILLSFVSGCTWTHYTQHSRFYYRRMAADFKEKDVTVILTNGEEFKGKDFDVRIDSTYWTDTVTFEKKAVRTSNILKFEARNKRNDRLKRINSGLLGGAFFGGFGGFLMAATISHEEEGIGYYPKYGGIYGSIGGAIFGLLYEYFGGTIHEYNLTMPKTAQQK